MQRDLLVPQPSLLMEDEAASHSARDELPCGALAKVGLEGDTAHRSPKVEDVGLGGVGERLNGHLACGWGIEKSQRDCLDEESVQKRLTVHGSARDELARAVDAQVVDHGGMRSEPLDDVALEVEDEDGSIVSAEGLREERR